MERLGIKETILQVLIDLKNDVMYEDDTDIIYITLNDFDEKSYDYRDFDDNDGIDSLIELLEHTSIFADGDYYRYYHYDDLIVCIGYATMSL